MNGNSLNGNSLDTLFLIRDVETRRVSSAAEDGSNNDSRRVPAGSSIVVAEIPGAGIIRHIWCTQSGSDPNLYTLLVLRMYWDGEESPSVEVPLGDFFGVGMNMVRNLYSEPLVRAPQDGRGMNSFFPMPFGRGARIELENQSAYDVNFYYYVDYEVLPEIPDDYGRFHAQWRREASTGGKATPEMYERSELSGVEERGRNWPKCWDIENRDGAGNYVILEATGRGHYVGCNLSVFNFSKQANDWYGEGDDMIFIDGDPMPTLCGTGTEDYFNTAFCPRTEYNAAWQGLSVYSGDALGRPWKGANCMYRFHVKDPIRFRKSIRVTIEHGHANLLDNDYTSTAYWYQAEPDDASYRLPPAQMRIPRTNESAE